MRLRKDSAAQIQDGQQGETYATLAVSRFSFSAW